VIPAEKGRIFNAWFSRHARGRIHGTFAAVKIRGAGRLADLAREHPLLVVSNHTSWWDPLVSLYVSGFVARTDGYALMDARNLERLPFFRKVGAFGVDLTDPSDGARAIRYAARLLDRPGRLLWVFPQGRERPITERPLGFRPGAAEIARLAKRAKVVPVALRYEFGATEKPSLWIDVGEPLPPERDVALALSSHEAAVTRALDAIDEALRGSGADAFETLHAAPVSVFAALAERLLARLTRPSKRLPPRASDALNRERS
jgi:1-acyl-sn-glycerol-3-phosphate acyltransferase